MDLLPTITEESAQDSQDQSVGVKKSDARRLAESASRLARQLDQSQKSLRQQEMELAARAAVISGQDARENLADRVEQLLSDACDACRCDAAAIYLLDDETQYLKTRAVFQLPIDRLEDAPRDLRGSRGDLEAMVQGVVTVDDFLAGGIDTWNAPENFAGGICVVLSDNDIPVGTLWLFASEIVEFGKQEQAAAKIAATAITSQLAHAAKDDKAAKPKIDETNSLSELTEWQHMSLPIGSELATGWRADGMIESPSLWASGWHTWDVLPDGTMMMAIAEMVDPTTRGAIGAIVARAALEAHSGYRHSPVQIIRRISDTLWQTNSGDQLTSILYLHVDPESGQGDFASAGSIAGLISSGYGYRPLVDGKSPPLGTHIEATPSLGTFVLQPGEALLAYTSGLINDGASQTYLGDCLRGAMQVNDLSPLAAIRREMAEMNLDHERGAISLTRSHIVSRW